jgi:hypothetical protein
MEHSVMSQRDPPEVTLGFGKTSLRGKPAIDAGWAIKVWLVSKAMSSFLVALCAVYLTVAGDVRIAKSVVTLFQFLTGLNLR